MKLITSTKCRFIVKLFYLKKYTSRNKMLGSEASNHPMQLYDVYCGHWKNAFFWIQGKKSASLLDHISRFLSHPFVTWFLRSISSTKIVKFFCPCMSEHVICIKNVTNVTKTLHQNVTNVTKHNKASTEIPTIEFHKKYMKLFVNMLSIICVLLNTKFHNTSENFYFEVISVQELVSCEVTNVTNRYMDFILNLIFKDLYVLTPTGSTIIN